MVVHDDGGGGSGSGALFLSLSLRGGGLVHFCRNNYLSQLLTLVKLITLLF